MNEVRKWSAVFLPCLLLTTESSPAQFVEVSVQIEETFWPLSSSGQQTERRRKDTARCVFGTNLWLIEGEFTLNARQTWWCTGTNIIKHTVITKELPERPEVGNVPTLAGRVPRLGVRFTTVYGPSDERPLGGIAHVTWLAFCSGSFLKSEGRRILPPFPVETRENEYSDKAQLFDDARGLPKRIEIYGHDKKLVCTYEVQQSTNFAGWTVPVRFEVTRYSPSGGGPVKPDWQGSARVTSIQKATQPLVPPEVITQTAR